MNKKYYVYKLLQTDTKEFYYGVAACHHCEIDEDTYMGSPKVWKPDYSKVTKRVIKSWIVPDGGSPNHYWMKAFNYENKLIYRTMEHPLSRNYTFSFYHTKEFKESKIYKELELGKHS